MCSTFIQDLIMQISVLANAYEKQKCDLRYKNVGDMIFSCQKQCDANDTNTKDLARSDKLIFVHTHYVHR